MAVIGGRCRRLYCPLPARYVLVIVAHAGFMIVYCLRVNMSVAIIAMVNATFADVNSTGNLDPECTLYTNTTQTQDKDGTFLWDQSAQGYILSSFFYGYLVMQIPASLLCSYIKSTTLLGIGILFTALLTLLTPLVANYSYQLLIVLRVLEGLCEGVTYPCMHSILSRWAPPSEIGLLAAIAYSGANSGTLLAFATSGFLCHSSFLGGWPSVFYIFGAAGIVWYVFWFFLVYESPSVHPWIDEREKAMILKTVVIKSRTRLDTVPWMSIVTSVPLWSLVVVSFCISWFAYTMLTGLPSFFKEVLNMPLRENGLLSAIPAAVAVVCFMLGGMFCDWLIERQFLSRTVARKLFVIIGCISGGGMTIAMTFFGCGRIPLAIASLAMGQGAVSGFANIHGVNQLDLAPQYADILLGITNTAGTLAGCLAPLAIGALTQSEPTRLQWQKVIYIMAGLLAFGCFLFLIFGDGKQQAWATDDTHCGKDEHQQPINDDAMDSDDHTVLI